MNDHPHVTVEKLICTATIPSFSARDFQRILSVVSLQMGSIACTIRQMGLFVSVQIVQNLGVKQMIELLLQSYAMGPEQMIDSTIVSMFVRLLLEKIVSTNSPSFQCLCT